MSATGWLKLRPKVSWRKDASHVTFAMGQLNQKPSGSLVRDCGHAISPMDRWKCPKVSSCSDAGYTLPSGLLKPAPEAKPLQLRRP